MFYSLLIIVGMQTFTVDSHLTIEDCREEIRTQVRTSANSAFRFDNGEIVINGFGATAVCVKVPNQS